MIIKESKSKARQVRHQRIRQTLSGTSERPRLAVFRSTKNIAAQIIDDVKSITLVSASTIENGNRIEPGSNIEAAKQVGTRIAQRALQKGITEVVFDRAGNQYHGRIKALADAARDAGLKF
jgi:large subunit ribosomal protein L18